MLTFFAKRIAISALLLFVVSFGIFLLVSLSPGDAAYTLLGSFATPENIAALRASMHLDEPLPTQYLSWLVDAVRGDLGLSLVTKQPVVSVVAGRLEPTFSLLALTMLVMAVVGTLLGVAGALRGGLLARFVDVVGLIGVAIPGFVVGLALIVVFAVRLRLLPFGGYQPLSSGVGVWAAGLVLPVAALAVGSVGLLAKQVRSSMLDAMNSEFIRTFKANGFSRPSIVYRHALRSAAVPVLAVMGVALVGLLGSSVLIEQVFGVPGLGGLAVQSTVQKDLPVVQGVAVVYTLIVIVVNLLLDVAYTLVNPKVTVR